MWRPQQKDSSEHFVAFDCPAAAGGRGRDPANPSHPSRPSSHPRGRQCGIPAEVAGRPQSAPKGRLLAHFVALRATPRAKRRPFKREINERPCSCVRVCNGAQSAPSHTPADTVSGPPESVISARKALFWCQKGARMCPFCTHLAPINYTPEGRPASARGCQVLAKAGQAGQAGWNQNSKPEAPTGAGEPGSQEPAGTHQPAGSRKPPIPEAGPPRQATTSNSRFDRKTGQNRHPTGPPKPPVLRDRPEAGPPRQATSTSVDGRPEAARPPSRTPRNSTPDCTTGTPFVQSA